MDSMIKQHNEPLVEIEFPTGSYLKVETSAYLRRSQYLGRGLAMVMLIACMPIIWVLVLIVRMTSRGPGLYTQLRVGKDGHIFVMYKLRSMVVDAEAATGPVWTQDKADPRITPVGRFLRKSHLDELPQLLNVARGEMAIFGPRPERPEIVQLLDDCVPQYAQRLAVKPGITGLAQINLPPDTDLESVRRKLQLDLEYIQHANRWLDFRMFLWTILRLVGTPAGWATRWLGVGRKVEAVAMSQSGPVTISDLLRQREEAMARHVVVKSTATEPSGPRVAIGVR